MAAADDKAVVVNGILFRIELRPAKLGGVLNLMTMIMQSSLYETSSLICAVRMGVVMVDLQLG